MGLEAIHQPLAGPPSRPPVACRGAAGHEFLRGWWRHGVDTQARYPGRHNRPRITGTVTAANEYGTVESCMMRGLTIRRARPDHADRAEGARLGRC